MAGFDPLWRDVWWPWLLVWGGTVVSIVVTVMITVTHRREHRKAAVQDSEQGRLRIAFYFDNDTVMNLYKQQEYRAALSHEVEHTIRKDDKMAGSIDLAQLQVGGSRAVSETTVRHFLNKAEQITVIGDHHRRFGRGQRHRLRRPDRAGDHPERSTTQDSASKTKNFQISRRSAL